MKKTISLALAIILALSCFGILAFGETFAAKDNRSQYVLSKVTRTNASGEVYSSTYTYDSAGNVTKSVFKEPGFTETIIDEYNKNRKAVHEVITGSDGFKQTTDCTFNSIGNITKKIYKNSDGIIRTTSYSYNSKGLIEKQKFNVKGGDSGSTVYSYDSKNRVVKSDFSETGGITETIANTFDSSGNLVKQIQKSSEEGKTTIANTYDKNGRITKKTEKNSDGLIWTTAYKYDSKGKLIKIVGKFCGEKNYETTYSYNSKGQLVKESNKAEGADSSTITYSYNSRGDKTKRVTKLNGKLYSTTVYKYKKLEMPSTVIVRGDIKVKLSNYQYSYNGKAKCPGVDITFGSEEDEYFLIQGPYYSVKYSNNVGPGKAKLVITFLDPELYGNPITINYEILPLKATDLKVVKASKTSAVLTWKKVEKADKYIVYKYNDKTDKYTKIATAATNKATIKNLKSGTTYKFCVKAVGGGVSGPYSSKISVKTK